MVWNLLGDWEYFALHLRLPHWASLSPCWQCDCHKNDEAKDWRVCWPGRGWELRDARVWQHRSDHAIFTLPGVSSWNACVDQHHTLEGKGVVSHFCGSVLKQLVYIEAGGRRPQEALALVWGRLQELYDILVISERLTHLSLNMFVDVNSPNASFPTLRSKAADTRHFVHPLLRLLRERYNGEARGRRRIAALEALTGFYNLCDSQPMFMELEVAETCLTYMEAFLAHHQWLHDEADEAGQLCYRVVPKNHQAWHLGFVCRYMNPRFAWTYKCESWVGKVSAVALSCASGTSMAKIPLPLAEKYRLLVHFRLSRGVYDS